MKCALILSFYAGAVLGVAVLKTSHQYEPRTGAEPAIHARVIQPKNSCRSAKSTVGAVVIDKSAKVKKTKSRCDGKKPAVGAIVVDQSKTPYMGSYPTLGLGMKALDLDTTVHQDVFIFPGIYAEQVYIPQLNSTLTVQGYTADCSSYSGNKVNITNAQGLANLGSNDLTATLRVWNNNTKVYNLNVFNTAGQAAHQALAVSAQKNNQAYYGVQLWSYQDTLLVNRGSQLVAKSLIVGAVDFVYGRAGMAWLEKVDLRTIGVGSVVANGRVNSTTPGWIVINESTVDKLNSTIRSGINYLGRPWSNFSRVTYQNTYLGDAIQAKGWDVWSKANPQTSNVSLTEYKNYGPGNIVASRANFSSQLTKRVQIDTLFGKSYKNEWWIDTDFI